MSLHTPSHEHDAPNHLPKKPSRTGNILRAATLAVGTAVAACVGSGCGTTDAMVEKDKVGSSRNMAPESPKAITIDGELYEVESMDTWNMQVSNDDRTFKVYLLKNGAYFMEHPASKQFEFVGMKGMEGTAQSNAAEIIRSTTR